MEEAAYLASFGDVRSFPRFTTGYDLTMIHPVCVKSSVSKSVSKIILCLFKSLW